VESHASVNENSAWRHDGHVGVHLSIHQPESQCLVPNQSLVMALRIGNALLMVPETHQRNYPK